MRGTIGVVATLLLLCVGVGCGDVTRPGTDDDGGPVEHDAAPIDAPPQPPPTPSREIVGGGGRVTGSTYTLDVEIGFPVSQQPAQGATYTIEGNAAVKP